MSLSTPTSILSLLSFVAVLVVGCGKPDSDPNVDPEKKELGAIYGLYRQYLKINQRPPEQLSDLQRFKATDPTGMQKVKDGRYVVVWGIKDTKAETILAYEKDAPTNGGWAVMANGTIKRLDASAFQNVPKSQK